MSEIMNSPKGVKSYVPERVVISSPHMWHPLQFILTRNQPCVTFGDQTIQHTCMQHRDIYQFFC